MGGRCVLPEDKQVTSKDWILMFVFEEGSKNNIIFIKKKKTKGE